MRLVIRGCWLTFLLLAAPLPCLADSIYLNEEGRRNLDALRLRIVPAPIFEDAAQKLSFIRCVIVGERAARNSAASYKSVEGSPDYDIVAFDGSGDQRSGTVTISAAWIEHIRPDIDSDLDVRSQFSNRDQLTGVALGSRAYFAMARRAVDPQGNLGLWRNDMPLPAEPRGVVEGHVVRYLKDPPVLGSDGLATKWNLERRAALDVAIRKALAERLPLAHLYMMDSQPNLLVRQLIDAVARERAYRLSRTGFDRTALSMLVFVLDLATVTPPEKPTGDSAARSIHYEGIRAVDDAVRTIGAAAPAAPAVEALGAPPCFEGPPFCLDPSQRAEVAIDALLASDGLFHARNSWRPLTRTLVYLLTTRPGAGPRSNDRIDLRDGAMRLLVHVINPPAGRDEDSRRQRQVGASEMRKELYGLLGDDRFPERYAAIRAALSAGGWGPELIPFVKALLNDAWSSSSDHPTAAAARTVNLRALAELAGSPVAAEREAAALILDRIEQMRKRQKDGPFDRNDRPFLEIWNGLSATPPR